MSMYELDEGIERLEYQFDYGIGSGKQTYSQKTQFITDFATKRQTTSSTAKETYRDQDSILHYFIPTTESEFLLDSYIQKLINSFLTSNSSINTIENKKQNSPISHEAQDHVHINDYMMRLKANVEKATRTNAPEMIGHMTTALPFFHRPLSKLLTSLNQNVVKVETSSTFTSLERQTLAIMHSVFYKKNTEFYERYSDSNVTALGMVCSGGTIANVSAIWIARNKALGPKGDFKGIVKEGLAKALKYYNYSGAVVIGSKLMHYSFKKAADLLGLGENDLILIDCDRDYRMRVETLEFEIKRLHNDNILILAVVAVAGTTETGSIDPLTRIAKLCNANGIHFHIDAAWGGPIIFSEEHGGKLNGVELSDSITVDGHKQLYTPMGLGVLLLKSPEDILSVAKTAEYVIRKDSSDLGKFTLEGSRPANILYLHACLNLLGKDGLGNIITRSCTLVKQMGVRLSEHPTKAFEILHKPEMNILLFRYIPKKFRNLKSLDSTENQVCNELCKMIHLKQNQRVDKTHGFTSRTNVLYKGQRVDCFRVVIANPLTEWKHIEELINDYIKMGKICEDDFEYEMLKQKVLGEYPFQGSEKGFWISWPCDL